MSDVPHGIDGGMTLVEDDEERRAGDTFCQSLAVQIFPAQIKKCHCSVFSQRPLDTFSFEAP